MMDHEQRDLAPRIRRLAAIAADLRKGSAFQITRLTVIKALCHEPRDAALFATFLATEARAQMDRPRPRSLDAQAWEHHRALADEALAAMQRQLDARSMRPSAALRDVFVRVKSVQDTYRRVAWGMAREVTDMPLFTIETGLLCMLSPDEAPELAYHMARDFAERYEPSHGTGLVPASAPFVEKIADFWSRHHLGRPIGELPAEAPRKRPKAAARRRPAPAQRPDTSPIATGYPAIARWVDGWGWIEIGCSEGSRSFVRALDIGGMIWEGKETYPSLDAALTALERALARWMAENASGR